MKYVRNPVTMELVSDNNIKVCDSAFVEIDSSWRAKDVCSPYTRLYFVTDGEGTLTKDGNIITMKRGFVYVIPAGCRFGYSCEGNLSKLYFHVNLFRRDGFDMLLSTDKICLYKIGEDEIKKLCERYLHTDSVNAVFVKSAIYHVLESFLSENGIDGSTESAYSELVLCAIDYIRNNLSVKLNSRLIADKLFVSESKLTKLFRNETGFAVGKYIDELIMFEAQRRLISTLEGIAEISDSLGFCDRFYFSRRFKDWCGETPARYRKKLCEDMAR